MPRSDEGEPLGIWLLGAANGGERRGGIGGRHRRTEAVPTIAVRNGAQLVLGLPKYDLGSVPSVGLPRSPLKLVTKLSRHGDRPALLDQNGPVSYARLAARTTEVGVGLGRGRRLVMVAVDNSIDGVVHYLGALAAGHVVLLAAPDPASIDAVVAAYDPDVTVVVSDGRAEIVERRAGSVHDLHPDLALLLSTSGSTGSAKLVRLSAAGVQSNAEAIAAYLRLGPADRAITSLPIHYCYGLSIIHSHLAVGASVVVTNRSVVDACFWRDLQRWSATSFAGVPHTFELLGRVGFDQMDVPSLRYVTQAGGRLAPEEVARYAELGARRGWELFVMYGQTEATARMAYLPPHLAAANPAAIGVPIPGGSFTLEPCAEAAAPDHGELVYRGPNVMLGYAAGPADLARGPDLAALRTGDLARCGPDGLYEIVGRRSRFLKLFGLRVDLDRVEQVLGERGADATCAGDDRRLVVAVTGDDQEPAVREVLQNRFGLPRGCATVVILEVVPRLANGKVDYHALTQAAIEQEPAETDPAAPARANIEPSTVAVCALYAEALGRADVDPTATFVGLGGDSLSYVEISVGLEDILGHLPTSWPTTTIADLVPVARPRRLAQLETGIVLRAVATVLVVATHAGLIELRGGAHILFGVAGFNFARFQLQTVRSQHKVRGVVGGVGRVAALSLATMAVPAVITGGYGWANVAFVNSHIGPRSWDQRWRYWYVEALVQILGGAILALSWRRARDLERNHPFAVAAGVAGLGLALRFFAVEPGTGVLATHRPQAVLWVFAVGWMASLATTRRRRLAATSVLLAGIPGFFGEPSREAVVAAGLLLLVWVPVVPVIDRVRRPLSAVAAASLWIYLLHWLIYQGVADRTTPLVAVAVSVAAGLAARRLEITAAPHLRRVATTFITEVRRLSRSAPTRMGQGKRTVPDVGS